MAKAMIVSGLTLGLALCAAAESQAQPPQPATDKVFVNVNVGGQLASRTLDATATKTIFAETATLNASQPINRGVLVDFAAGYRVWGDVFAGVLVSWFGDSETSTAAVAVPDPIFTDRPKIVTLQLSDLKRTEITVAPHVAYALTLTDKMDLALAGGISFISLSQDLPTAIGDPPAGTQNVTVSSANQSGSGVGPFAQVDVIYNITPRIGVGGFARFSGAKVDLDSSLDNNVGGMQAGGGIRLHF